MRSTLLLALLPILSACPAGQVAKTASPPAPTVGNGPRVGDNGDKACDPNQNYEFLVVDWEPEQRGDLEVAMKRGVVAMRYTCDRLEILEDCTSEGSYGYLGMTSKEKVVRMENADELKANLPLHAVSWIADAKVGFERGNALDAAMVMVGARKSPHHTLSASDLHGDCAGATHYVASSTLGAFVVATSTGAEIESAASLFGKGVGGKTSSTTSVHSKDGDVKACSEAKPEATSPPAQCAAIVRLKLKALRDDKPTAGEAVADPRYDVVNCPAGTVWADGACHSRSGEPHQCELGNATDCHAQCKAGDAESCSILASMHWRGDNVRVDKTRAAELHIRACDMGIPRSCRYAGLSYRDGSGVKKNPKRARALFEQACNLGEGMGCVDLGHHLVTAGESSDALTAFRRACYGGEFEGCGALGSLYEAGAAGLRQNPKLAAKFYEKGCKEGSPSACGRLSRLHATGKGVKLDKARAAELAERACRLGESEFCQ